MVRYSKSLLTLTNISLLITTVLICKDTYSAFDKCQNIWGITVASGVTTALLLFDSIPKICSEKKIIWSSYCCIPIPYTIIIYSGMIALCIYQASIYFSLNPFCKSFYDDNYNTLNTLCILQICNFSLNLLLFY
jgi:hypothetical protein